MLNKDVLRMSKCSFTLNNFNPQAPNFHVTKECWVPRAMVLKKTTPSVRKIQTNKRTFELVGEISKKIIKREERDWGQ